MAEDFWSRIARQNGLGLDFGSLTNWGQVPHMTGTAAPATVPANPWQPATSMGGMDWAGTANADGSTTTSIGGSVAPISSGARAPWLTQGQARTGLGQPNQSPTPSGTFGERFLADWAYGGDQLGGGQYVNGAWQHGAPVAAGTDLAQLGVATRGGYALPVGYDSRQDTARFELNGRVHETSWSRVLRKAQDLVGQGRAWGDAFNQALALVEGEARAQGKTTGFGATAQQGGGNGNGQQGGETVVAPAYDPGGGGGGTTPGQGTGNGMYNQFLATSPAARAAMLLDRLGFGSPEARSGVLGSAIGRTANLFDPWLRTQGLGANGTPMMDNLPGMIDRFAAALEGNNFYGTLQQDARNAIGTVMGGGNPLLNPNTMPYDELHSLLEGFNELVYQGANPWLQKAFGRVSDDALGQFITQEGRARQAGTTPLNYAQFLQGDPRYAFLTGR